MSSHHLERRYKKPFYRWNEQLSMNLIYFEEAFCETVLESLITVSGVN